MHHNFDWNPWTLLTNESSCRSNYGIIVLNTPIFLTPEFLLPLWNKASLKLTVDGGTNRWFSWLGENGVDEGKVKNPDLVTGDMDSIEDDILERIEKQNICNIVVTEDQNETDFTKALREIKRLMHTDQTEIECIIVICDTSGRLDQVMANINTLFKSMNIFENTNIFQLANDSLSWLLRPGKHKIQIPQMFREKHTWCALIPIGQQSDRVTTTGLKWNLVNKTMKFGDLVSTSNTYGDQEYVTILTETILLWSMGLHGISSRYVS